LRIFGLERDEIVGGWRKPREEELHNLCSSPNIIRRMSLAGHVACLGRTGMHIGFWYESQRKGTTRKTRT
jgi:hypothetical protein